MSDRTTRANITRIAHGPDGETLTVFRRTVDPPDDRYVRSRLEATDGSEVITEYVPTPVRPPSYPDWLPFLAGRSVHTTESQPGGMSPGARWPCSSRAVADAVLADVEHASAAAGWKAAPGLQLPGGERASGARVLVRGERARVLLVAPVNRHAIVQLLEMPITDLQGSAG